MARVRIAPSNGNGQVLEVDDRSIKFFPNYVIVEVLDTGLGDLETYPSRAEMDFRYVETANVGNAATADGAALRAASASAAADAANDPASDLRKNLAVPFGKDHVTATTLTAGRALTAADAGRVLEFDSSSDVYVTIPLDDGTIPVGSVGEVARIGAGRVWVLPTAWNLIGNPSVETSASEYIERNGTLQRIAAAAIFGGFGLRATSNATGTVLGWFGPSLSLADFNLRPGDVVSARLNVKADAGLTAQVQIRFRAGTTIKSTFAGNLINNGVSKSENMIIPDGVDNVLFLAGTTNTTAVGQVLDTDGLMFGRGPTAPDAYADGDTAGYSWTGTAHASPSMGPLVRGLGLTIPRGGRVRWRKRAANDWVCDNLLPPEALKVTDKLTSDRDNGQAGIVAPSGSRFTLTTLALAANQAYLARFAPSRVMPVTRVAFRVTTASGSNDPVEVAIFDASGTRVATSGAVTGQLNSTGTKVVTIPTATLAAGGVYYAVLAANSTATVTAVTGVADAFGTAAPAAELLTKTASYPLPSTLSGLAVTDTAPALWVRES